MRKLFLILLVILLFGCEQQPDIEELSNIPPMVKIIEGDSVIENGADLTLTTYIIDPDNVIFESTWLVNEIVINYQKNFTFAAYPVISTDYKITVRVSDGQDEGIDSVIITVLGPPWSPQTLHVYIFPVGAELSDYTWEKHYIATDPVNYWDIMNGANLKVQEHNVFYPDDPWYYIGGGI